MGQLFAMVKTLHDDVSSLVGAFIASVATFELELDDLFALAGSQIDGLFSDILTYPVQISDKIKQLPKIAATIHEAWDTEEFCSKSNGILELWNFLVHGKISSVQRQLSGFLLVVKKMGLPEKNDGRQLLQRTNFNIHSTRIVNAIKGLSDLEQSIERLRKTIFQVREGWPDYRPPPSGKPFGASNLVIKISKLSAAVRA